VEKPQARRKPKTTSDATRLRRKQKENKEMGKRRGGEYALGTRYGG